MCVRMAQHLLLTEPTTARCLSEEAIGTIGPGSVLTHISTIVVGWASVSVVCKYGILCCDSLGVLAAVFFRFQVQAKCLHRLELGCVCALGSSGLLKLCSNARYLIMRSLQVRHLNPGFRFPHAYVRPGGRYA